MSIPDFARVLAAAQDGSEWAWDTVVRDVGPRLTGFFRARGVADPEGLTSDVFIDLARSIGRFDGDEPAFRSWVFVIAYRRMSDEWRRQRRRPDESPIGLNVEPATAARSAEEVVMESLDNADVVRLLNVLTDDQRDVIGLRVIAGLTLAETSQVVGKPIGAVKALQRRGVAALRRHFEQ